MTEDKMEALLFELIEADFEAEEERIALEIERVTTFGDTGVLTNNRGLVIRVADGSEFQVSIVQSR